MKWGDFKHLPQFSVKITRKLNRLDPQDHGMPCEDCGRWIPDSLSWAKMDCKDCIIVHRKKMLDTVRKYYKHGSQEDLFD